jgi:hypothetical protein
VVEIRWRNGAIAGFLAMLAMSVAIALRDLEVLRVAVAGLYGSEGSLVVGWVAHLLHGSLFGVLFAAVLTEAALEDLTASTPRTTAAGAVYGMVLAVAGAGSILPIWLAIVGVGALPDLPHVTLPLLAWHLVYGVVLGGVFAHLDHSPPPA